MLKPIKGGVLRVSREFMWDFISDLFTGKKKLTNKNLRLRGITRLNDDIPFFSCEYDFGFTADDLPDIPEGCNPTPSLKIKTLKNKKNCFKLV